ncbi:MAG: hypothetical protein R3C25_09235 [Hyphomonadaceae bacterium]
MADRQALNATFFAFAKRDRGGVLAGATVAFAIAAAVLVAVFAALFWSSLLPLISWYGEVIRASATNDTAAIENLGFPAQFFGFFGGLLLWLFPFYILCAAYEAACLRWMIHGETEGFMGLSLAAPTWRVWGCYWMWFLLNMAFSIVMSIVMMAVMGALAVGSGGNASVTVMALPFFYLLQYGLMIYFGVRFAPAAATTIARRRFSFFDAWAVTKDRFWALFGSFLLLYVGYMLVSLLLVAGWFVSVLGSSAPDLGAMQDPAQFSEALTEILGNYLRSFMQPRNWIIIGVLQVLGLIAATVFYVAMYGVNARAALAALEEGKIKPAA